MKEAFGGLGTDWKEGINWALAPLLFTARGVLARSGAAGSHLAGVARSLSVPMVTGCHPETVTGAGTPGAPWLAAIDGATGDVALLQG